MECYYYHYYLVVVVDDDTYYWVYLSSDHPFRVYYKVQQVLLQSAMVFITNCNNSITKCDRTPTPIPPRGQDTLGLLLGKQNIQTKEVYKRPLRRGARRDRRLHSQASYLN